MELPCSCCRKGNWLTTYGNNFFIVKNSTTESLLIGPSKIKDPTRYKGTSYKYFSNRLNFCISGNHAENTLWGALNLPDIPYLTNVIILCGTNNICNDSHLMLRNTMQQQRLVFVFEIAQLCIPRILPRDE